MGNTIDNSTIKTDLEEKLKATNLSENEIKEIVPEILKLINLKENVENKQTESTTQNFLLDLREDIENNSNVSIDIKRNKGTVVGAMNINTVTNNISITINQPNAQNIGQTTTEAVSGQTTTEAISEQTTTEAVPGQTTTEAVPGQTTTEAVPGQTTTEAVPGQTTTEVVSGQTTTEVVSGQTTTEAENSANQQTKPEEITYENSSTYSIESIKQIDIHSYDGFLLAINKTLEEIKNMKKGTSKRGLPEAGKRTMEDAKSKLKYYEDILKKKKKALVKEKKVNNNDITTLQNIFTELGDIDYDIHKGQWGEYSNTAGYPYNSPEIARKSNKRQIEDLQFNQNFQKELREGAISTIFNGNIQKTNDFLRRIAQREYDEADYQTYIRNAAIINPCLQRYGIPMPNDPKGRISGGNFERSPRTSRTTNDYRNLDRGEAFQQGGLAGIVDKALSNCNNLTPGQRNTWKNIAVLGGYAAGIYGLFKFFTNKNMGFWTKAGITATAIFGSQALTGENPITLFNKLLTGGFSKEELESKFGNAFGDAVDGVHNSSIEGAENISGAMYSLMVFNKTTKVGEVRALSTRFKNNPQEWSLFRGQAIENLGTKNFERFSATFSENFDEAKWNSWLNSIGIHDGIDDNKLVYELATVKTMNAIVINKFLSDNGVKVTDDKTKKEEYEQYIKSMNDNNQAIDVDVLKSHMEKNDRFKQDNEATFTDREKDKDNRKALEDQVEALSIDAQKKAELKTAIIRFYDERTIDSKPELSDFSLKIENGLLVLSSHGGHEAKININNGELDGFGKGIRFSSLSDLINTADIANKVLESQKGKLPKDLPVFQYKPERKGICFNDATSIWQDIVNRNNSGMDTRVLSTGRLGATSKIETLSKHPEDYATYLSERWIKENKINIDSTLYPTVKTLSESGIIFTNEQEVKNLEDWLKGIKENLKFAVSTPDGNPFSITFTNKLEFKAVNGDSKDFPENISEKFPTLLRTGNKEKFLKIMNDPNNKMRGSN